jgi:hypothetical protein
MLAPVVPDGTEIAGLERFARRASSAENNPVAVTAKPIPKIRGALLRRLVATKGRAGFSAAGLGSVPVIDDLA